MRLIPGVEAFLDRYFSSSMAASQPFELLPSSSSSSSSPSTSDVTSGNAKVYIHPSTYVGLLYGVCTTTATTTTTTTTTC